MKILFAVGACLNLNTSANMSHNSYIAGLVETGNEVDVLMADSSFGSFDKKFKNIQGAEYYVYPYYSKLAKRLSVLNDSLHSSAAQQVSLSADTGVKNTGNNKKSGIKSFVKSKLKKAYRHILKYDYVYNNSYFWITNTAKKFKSDTHYDLVISNSSPAASHKVVSLLKNNGNISYDKWVQIWEDPWSHDIYANVDNRILEEERKLLSQADVIFYVSPLTLENQKEIFPESADKMKFVPLPFFKYSDDKKCVKSEKFGISIGYFGDYYSKTRNILPLYNAVCETGCIFNVCGDTDLNLCSDDKITVKPRVGLNELSVIQDNTDILVCICNLGGGQIPGKIYHYSVTDKPILFLLDGNDKEKKLIKEYFEPYNRFIFCENNVADISAVIREFQNGSRNIVAAPIDSFSPSNIALDIIRKIAI